MQSSTTERKQAESICNSTPDLSSNDHAGGGLGDNHYHTGFFRRTTQLLSRFGIETHGIAPVPAEERLETRWYQMFFVWFSSNMNILGFSTGTTGPAFFSLGVRDSIAIILIVNLVYFGAIIPAVLNVLSLEGFLILNCIIGGQTIASFSSQLDDNLGIVIIGIISLAVSRSLSVDTVLSIGGTTPILICTKAFPGSRIARIFIYTYLGFFVSNLTGQALGAAFAAAAPSVPAWNAGFQDSSSVGGLLYSVLLPAGVFGKILTALVALSIPSACAPTMYTFSTSFMAVATYFAAVPRWVYILISEGILIPVAIIGAKSFYTTFVGILDIVGYWSSAFAAIILTEHVLFRRASFSEDQYPITTWASHDLLPSGIPAVVAFACACGALVPFMSQAWYVGPVARRGSGDVGVFVGFVVGAIVYALARNLEKMWCKKKELSKSDTFSTLATSA
ncbi:hypothetical protein DEU56DRAFT_949253 [Suillus clintonianus]|uniref:uncharacterized protein n=1 Tax=Suillus clintonianus TaxID=1904413 RepID=UPI001B8634FD|nr:uncharacterized protein DEU56DRAFT_949253 [Suillus clintonianus]KAG2135296.1 hypothetical protein DEU56DRAFT_949253 [Suillus clintonianus]